MLILRSAFLVKLNKYHVNLKSRTAYLVKTSTFLQSKYNVLKGLTTRNRFNMQAYSCAVEVQVHTTTTFKNELTIFF